MKCLIRSAPTYDDIDAPFAVGNSHTPDDEFSVRMQQGIQRFHRFRILHNDAHNRYSCLHAHSLLPKIFPAAQRCGSGKEATEIHVP